MRFSTSSFLALVFFLSACKNSPEPFDVVAPKSGLPRNPGDVQDPLTDAGAPLPVVDAQEAKQGSLCLINDLRFVEICELSDQLGGLLVSIDSEQNTTLSDGRFEYFAPEEGPFFVRVDDDQGVYVTSIVAHDSDVDSLEIPLVEQSTFDGLLVSLGAPNADGSASLALRFTNDEGPVADIQVTAPAGTPLPPYYDMGDANLWTNDGATRADGSALVFSVPVNGATTSLVYTYQGQNIVVNDIPIAADALTFAHIVLLDDN